MGLFGRKEKQQRAQPPGAEPEGVDWDMMEGLVHASEMLKAAEMTIDPALEPYAEALRSDAVQTQMTLLTEIPAAQQQALEQHQHVIAAAQERLVDGTYGICIRCHKRIASDRLLALPTTTACAGCAQAAGG